MKRAKLNILMVEDNLVNQKVLSKQLQKMGCVVHVAGDGTGALEWLRGSVYWRGDRKDPPIDDSRGLDELDIILMDIEMPIMDGLTCARLIRDYERDGLLTISPSLPPQDSALSASPIPSFSELEVIIDSGAPLDLCVSQPAADAFLTFVAEIEAERACLDLRIHSLQRQRDALKKWATQLRQVFDVSIKNSAGSAK